MSLNSLCGLLLHRLSLWFVCCGNFQSHGTSRLKAIAPVGSKPWRQWAASYFCCCCFGLFWRFDGAFIKTSVEVVSHLESHMSLNSLRGLLLHRLSLWFVCCGSFQSHDTSRLKAMAPVGCQLFLLLLLRLVWEAWRSSYKN